jgi:branched-chain amino acid transport system substrate-binding protein
MKRKYLLTLLLLLTMLFFTACGGGDTTTPEPEATEATTEEEPTEEEMADTPEPEEEMADTPEPEEEMADTPEPVEEEAAFTCDDPLGCVDIAPDDPIHIAWIQTVSGGTALLGTDNNRGVEIAIDDIGGELLGHPIEFTGEDSLCSIEGGQAAGTRIAADSTIVAIIGTTCSSEARGAMPLIADAGMVMISSSNTNPDLTNPEHPDHHPGYLRTAHNDLFQGRVAAEFAYNELGVRTAATIHDGSPYAESLQQVFADVFVELGGTITAQEAVNVGDTDMQPVLTTIAADSPELIYFPIFEPEGPFIAAQKCDVAGLEETIMMGADGLLTASFASASGDCSVGMYLSGPYVAGDAYAEFVAKYEDKYGEGTQSGFHAHAYDAANMIFAAIEQVAVQDADGTLHIGRQALRDALYGMQDYQGLTGVLSCDENGDCATGEALAVFQIAEVHVDGSENLLSSTPAWIPGE